MAKFDEIKKANDEQKRLNKSLDAAVLRVETMEKNYAKFSDKRAKAVVDYLTNSGVAASRLTAKGFGESAPIDTNDTRAGRANNRRVEIILVK